MALGRIALRRTDRLQRIFVASGEVLDPRGTKLSARRWRQRRCPISVVRTPMPAGRVLRRPILARHHARSGASALPASLSEAVEQPHIIHFPHPRDPLLMEPCRRSHGSEVVHDILSLGDVVTPGQRCPQANDSLCAGWDSVASRVGLRRCSGVIAEQITSNGDDVDDTPVLGIAGLRCARSRSQYCQNISWIFLVSLVCVSASITVTGCEPSAD
jgi:hypothetical protein